MTLLADAAKQTGAAILLTHEPRVAAYSDREVMVRDGKSRQPESVPAGRA